MENKMKNSRLIFDFIGDHPEYGKHRYVCHVCGTDCDIAGKISFTGDTGAVWEGEHFEFPICASCFWSELAKAMEHMDSVMVRREIEREKRFEAAWLNGDWFAES